MTASWRLWYAWVRGYSSSYKGVSSCLDPGSFQPWNLGESLNFDFWCWNVDLKSFSIKENLDDLDTEPHWRCFASFEVDEDEKLESSSNEFFWLKLKLLLLCANRLLEGLPYRLMTFIYIKKIQMLVNQWTFNKMRDDWITFQHKQHHFSFPCHEVLDTQFLDLLFYMDDNFYFQTRLWEWFVFPKEYFLKFLFLEPINQILVWDMFNLKSSSYLLPMMHWLNEVMDESNCVATQFDKGVF